MAAYFFSSPIDIEVRLEGEELRKQVESKSEKDRPVSCPIYYDGESVSGQVRSLLLPVFTLHPVSVRFRAPLR
jgi:vacuolar protein sorting-associated protein 26